MWGWQWIDSYRKICRWKIYRLFLSPLTLKSFKQIRTKSSNIQREEGWVNPSNVRLSFSSPDISPRIDRNPPVHRIPIEEQNPSHASYEQCCSKPVDFSLIVTKVWTTGFVLCPSLLIGSLDHFSTLSLLTRSRSSSSRSSFSSERVHRSIVSSSPLNAFGRFELEVVLVVFDESAESDFGLILKSFLRQTRRDYLWESKQLFSFISRLIIGSVLTMFSNEWRSACPVADFVITQSRDIIDITDEHLPQLFILSLTNCPFWRFVIRRSIHLWKVIESEDDLNRMGHGRLQLANL